MKVVQRLKKAFKAAIRSGKIFYDGAIEETYTSDKIPAVDLLTIEQWKVLEENERGFRSHLASKKYNYGDFICKGDLESWMFLKSWSVNQIIYNGVHNFWNLQSESYWNYQESKII